MLGTGYSWWDLPEEEFGPWQTAYKRYRRWHEEGPRQHGGAPALTRRKCRCSTKVAERSGDSKMLPS